MQAPCRNKPGFEQPGDYPFWHLNPDTIAAQTMCFHCPLRTTCATQALTHDTPDGVILAGVICRGDDRTADMLATIANPTPEPEPEHLAQVIPITAARRGRRPRHVWPKPCVMCHRDMMPRSRMADGFVRHESRGVCQTCRQEERRAAA